MELINVLLGYNRGDEIPTHRGPLSIRAIAERLMKARSVETKHHVTEWPLHVRGLRYYVPEAVLDADESPVLAAPLPVRESGIPRRPPFVDPSAHIRAMVVDSGGRAPAAPRRSSVALPLRSVAPPRSPSFTVSPPSTRPPAPAVFSGRPSRFRAPIRSAPPLSDLVTAHVDLAEFRGAYPCLHPILDHFGYQRTARLRGVLNCVSSSVRAADPHSVKASQRSSRGGSAAERHRAREELAEAEARRRELRRELDAMVGRVAQLTAQLCDYSGGVRLGKRRRDYYAPARRNGYGRPHGWGEYEGD